MLRPYLRSLQQHLVRGSILLVPGSFQAVADSAPNPNRMLLTDPEGEGLKDR